MKSEFTLPTVHLNGTPKEELLKGYHEAYRALAKAIESIDNTTLNPRDYYVNPDPNAWSHAVSERREQWAKLREVLYYLEAHVEHLF